MNVSEIRNEQWSAVREIYREAFPKEEQKPFFLLKHAVKAGRAQLWTGEEDGVLQGFIEVIPYQDLVLVEYLAVSGKIRSRGAGSRILRQVCEQYRGRRIVLLIEEVSEAAENYEQRVARKRFYLKNGFTSPDVFVRAVSGVMEVLSFGGPVTGEEFLRLQAHALGKILFALSKTEIAKR